jgi:tRNA 2-thiocytidine biosynthesis protein TtcA
MPAKLASDDGRHIVIRPLVYVAEDDLAAYAGAKGFPIIPCTLCGSQENLQRKVVRQMLAEWDKRHPGRIDSILRALSDVRPSHLMDSKLFDFVGLKAGGSGSAGFGPSFEAETLGEPLFAE